MDVQRHGRNSRGPVEPEPRRWAVLDMDRQQWMAFLNRAECRSHLAFAEDDIEFGDNREVHRIAFAVAVEQPLKCVNRANYRCPGSAVRLLGLIDDRELSRFFTCHGASFQFCNRPGGRRRKRLRRRGAGLSATKYWLHVSGAVDLSTDDASDKR